MQNELPEVQCSQINSTRDSKDRRCDISISNLPRVRKRVQNNGNNVRRNNSKNPVDWSEWWPFERATGRWLVALNKRQPKPIASTEYEDATF